MGETLLAPLPVIVAAVRAVFQLMLNVAGMRMRRSFAAVMLGVAASVTVIAAMAVGPWPTTKRWFAAEATVGGVATWIVRLSLAAVPPPEPETTSCR